MVGCGDVNIDKAEVNAGAELNSSQAVETTTTDVSTSELKAYPRGDEIKDDWNSYNYDLAMKECIQKNHYEDFLTVTESISYCECALEDVMRMISVNELAETSEAGNTFNYRDTELGKQCLEKSRSEKPQYSTFKEGWDEFTVNNALISCIDDSFEDLDISIKYQIEGCKCSYNEIFTRFSKYVIDTYPDFVKETLIKDGTIAICEEKAQAARSRGLK